MAIISNFPVGNSELTPLYEVSGLFPALIKSSRDDYKTGRVIILGNRLMADTQSDVEEPYIDDLTIYPLMTFYIRLSLRGSYVPPEEKTFVLDPGHVYRIHRGYRTPSSSYDYSGSIAFYKDGNETFTSAYPTDGTICNWQITPFA